MNTALKDFSGYIAADELYDGPFCVLFIVDNHNFRRLCYEVLNHDPTHDDIIRFFKRFKGMLEAHELSLVGITTDGSPLYPDPIVKVFGDVKRAPPVSVRRGNFRTSVPARRSSQTVWPSSA